DHSAYWANLLGEIVREFPMHFGSWRNIPPERKAGILRKIRKLSDPNVPRTSLWKIGMRKSGLVRSQEHGSVCSKCSKSGKEHSRMPAGIPDTCCPPRYADAELRDSRVSVSNLDLLRYPYSGGRILADDMYSQLFTQLQSHHESGSGSGCGAGEDDESGDDEDAGKDANS
nr:hypothetical protein [Tanacetum cinerariifolium]